MIGTIANTIAIVIGSFIGGTIGDALGSKYKDVLFTALGLACLGIGLNAVVHNMPNSAYPVLFIASLAIGGVVGTALDLDGRFKRAVDKRSKGKGVGEGAQAQASGAAVAATQASGSGECDAALAQVAAAPAQVAPAQVAPNQAATASAQAAPAAAPQAPSLASGLSTAIMLFCVGTLSILGPINSALYGDETFLFTNATLDFVTSMALASTFGVGIAFAAAVLFAWQGSIFLCASFLAPLLSGGLMAEISIVGGFLIVASGLSLLEIKEIKSMNLLPALFVPPVWFVLISLTNGFFGLI